MNGRAIAGLPVRRARSLAGRHRRSHASGEGSRSRSRRLSCARRKATPTRPGACGWSWSATARCEWRSCACSTRLDCAHHAWLPGSAPTWPTSCAAWIASCCRRWPRASRIRSSRRWRAGLPVIATRVGGNAELVDDGSTGRLVPAADTATRWRARCSTISTTGAGAPPRGGRAAGRARALQPRAHGRATTARSMTDCSRRHERRRCAAPVRNG